MTHVPEPGAGATEAFETLEKPSESVSEVPESSQETGPAELATSEPAPGFSAVSAVFVGWFVVALWNLVGILSMPLAPDGVSVRLKHLAIDLGHLLSVALALAALVFLWTRYGPRRLFASGLAIAALAMTVGVFTLGGDLEGGLERLGPIAENPWTLRAACALSALPVAFCFLLGRWLGKTKLSFVGVGLGTALVIGNDFILKSGYPGAHALLATGGATLISASLAGTPVSWIPRFARAAAGYRFQWPPAPATLGILLLLTLAAGFSVLSTPSSRVQVELLKRDTALLVPWLRARYAPSRIGSVDIPRELRPWYQSRSGRPDVPPNHTKLVPDDVIVLLITIDALRLEVLEPKLRHVTPNLQEIKENSIYFSQARSSGSDTRFSLAALFTGMHYSMLKWNRKSRARPTLERDERPRLPELLEQGGVPAVSAITLEKMLVPEIGIVRGFSETYHVSDAVMRGEGHRTEEVMDQLIDKLRRHPRGPLFFYTHLLDPHHPYYTYGQEAPTPYDAYLLEVKLVDTALGRLRRTVREMGLQNRVVWIIGSDHGEGFGEHGIYKHNKTLYDIMVHVPLMIEIPGVRPRTVDQFVALMDVGPTVLDLFGLPTPGHWVSESLVPFLLGGRTPPTRPLLMEKPQEKAMLFPDGLKVMTRRGTEEIYDVRKDPGETNNLREALGAEGDRRVALLRTYIQVHSGRVPATDD